MMPTRYADLLARVEELEGVVHSLRAQMLELVGVRSSKRRGSSEAGEVLGGAEIGKVDRELIAEGEGDAGDAGGSGASATHRVSKESRKVLGGAKRDEADRGQVMEERGNGEEGAGDVEGRKVGTGSGGETGVGSGAEKEEVDRAISGSSTSSTIEERKGEGVKAASGSGRTKRTHETESKPGTVVQVVELVSSYTQTSKDETNEGDWRRAKSGGRPGRAKTIPPVSLGNRFEVLASVDDSGKEEVDTLVIGDSRVRPLRRAFGGGKDRCVVKPGAKVADIDLAVGTELSRCSPSRVVVQVGVNNIGPRASVRIEKEYRSLLQRLSEARKPVYITGVLPRIWASSEWHSRALALNFSVRKMCADMGLHYVDLWDEFYGRNMYYLRDGLHLSDEGARVLAAKYRSAFQGN